MYSVVAATAACSRERHLIITREKLMTFLRDFRSGTTSTSRPRTIHHERSRHNASTTSRKSCFLGSGPQAGPERTATTGPVQPGRRESGPRDKTLAFIFLFVPEPIIVNINQPAMLACHRRKGYSNQTTAPRHPRKRTFQPQTALHADFEVPPFLYVVNFQTIS